MGEALVNAKDSGLQIEMAEGGARMAEAMESFGKILAELCCLCQTRPTNKTTKFKTKKTERRGPE